MTWRRALALIVVVLGIAVSAPVATAQPVSRAVARAEILHHYWRDRRPPRIRWCVPKRYGTVCLLAVPFRKHNHFGWARGHEMQCVWVSRTRERVSADLLWATLSVTLGGF